MASCFIGQLKSCWFAGAFCWRKTCVDGKLPLFSKSKWPSLIVGCFGMAIAASAATFDVWQNAMRARLNQTVTDSNIVANMATVGSVIAFPAGYLYETYGGQADSAIGGLIAVICYFLLALGTSYWKYTFAANQWFVYIIYFFIGFASIFTYMGAMMPNIDNFSLNQRGKIIGILDGALSLGPTVLSIVYNTAFTNGYTQAGQEVNQSLPAFFLVVALLHFVIGLANFLFTGRLFNNNATNEIAPFSNGENSDNHQNEEREDDKSPAIESQPPNKFSEFPFAELSIKQVVLRWNFYFLLVQFVLASCAQTTYHSNLSTFLRSFNMMEYNLLFTVLNTTLQAISKFLAGFLSDIIASRGKMPRAVIFLVPYSLQTVFWVVSAFCGDNIVVMIFTVIVVGMSYGVNWCLTPILLGELFGSKHLASNWGWAELLTGALGFPFSIGFSSIYESFITQPGSIYCDGLGCFTWSFVLFAGSSFCSFVMALGLTENMYGNAKNRQLYELKLEQSPRQERNNEPANDTFYLLD